MHNTIQSSSQKLHPYFEKEWKQYLVRQVMQNVFHPYFLTKSQEVQEKCLGQFEQHMEILARHTMDWYINNPDGLTIDYIRGIHKNIYGWLTNIKIKTTLWEEEYMTPGEFKTKQNGISRLNNPWTYLICTPPEKVGEELQKLLSSLHEWNGYIYKKIIHFFLTFTEIHPFPDDNGKIGLMLVDLILIKNDLYPFFMSSFKWAHARRFYEMIQEYSHGAEKDMIPFYTMIGESYANLYEQKYMADFYKNSPEFFIDFLKNTDEKKILSEKVIHFLETKYSKTSHLVISDIWAGSGIVAKEIIQYLRGAKKEFQYNYIEPAHSLIEHFAHDFDCSGIVFYEGNIENITIPKSDFIITSHVLQYIDNLEWVLWKILTALNSWGTLLIIQPNIESQEMILKEKIETHYGANIGRIFPILQRIKESFSYEQVETNIYHMQDMQDLNENGKKMISFFYNKPFDIIKDEEVERIQNVIKELWVNDHLIKEEDYIWVEKYSK